MSHPQTTELSKRDWKMIRTCLILRCNDLEARKKSDEDLRIPQIKRILEKTNEN